MRSLRLRRLIGVATLITTVAMLFLAALLAFTDVHSLPLWALLVKPLTSLCFVWSLVVLIRLIVVLSPDTFPAFCPRGELDRLLQDKRQRHGRNAGHAAENEGGRDSIVIAERLREGAWEAVQRGCLARLVKGKRRRDGGQPSQ